jgi:hypothetical protein
VNDAGRKEAWKKAREAALQIHRMAACSPEDERYELAVELIGGAHALAMALSSEVDPDQVADAASGSVERLDCLLILAQDLGLFGKTKLRNLRERLDELRSLIDVRNSKP